MAVMADVDPIDHGQCGGQGANEGGGPHVAKGRHARSWKRLSRLGLKCISNCTPRVLLLLNSSARPHGPTCTYRTPTTAVAAFVGALLKSEVPFLFPRNCVYNRVDPKRRSVVLPYCPL